jgi:hypothetical protein
LLLLAGLTIIGFGIFDDLTFISARPVQHFDDDRPAGPRFS